MTRTLVIASGNAGKVVEFHRLLQDWPVTLVPQPTGLEVDENGSTFAENAHIKARAVARLCGHWALADARGSAWTHWTEPLVCVRPGTPPLTKLASVAF